MCSLGTGWSGPARAQEWVDGIARSTTFVLGRAAREYSLGLARLAVNGEWRPRPTSYLVVSPAVAVSANIAGAGGAVPRLTSSSYSAMLQA